ncbi:MULTISPECIES: hypothetical protein [unclassified Crossiella]|uniref:hypothetical protein n=1 Tax=unclassified Crossiella TaxID=2620835 RepID=UPI002000515E|nr:MULTISPECIES: hypothetical protein [unclassified Crossiella]MCK2237707.1 hypothetical protein [Crossiella sp. S99.2]MCK2254993.1 hypothetical protein [Crossiella sp. S99.1]
MADQPDIIERLNTEAQGATAQALPQDTPELRPWLGLPRRDRAEVIRRFTSIRPHLDKLSTPPTTADQAEVLGQAADGYALMADIEDLLAVAAVDENMFRSWALTATDESLLALFTVMVDGLGEAGRSPS